jgi:aminocarboxymuconate-semialdehyde decarboxylase
MIAPYGPTAARKRGRPGRETRPRSTTIDVHSHVAVPAAAAVVAPHLDTSTIPLAFFSTADTKQVNAKQEADRASRITGRDQGLAERLHDLDDMGIDIQVVMPPPPQCYYTVPLDIAVKATRIVNEGIAEYVARRPDRFVGLGSVPMTDGNEAAAELERSMRSLGLKGAQVLTNVAGAELSAPQYAAFWKKAEELGAPIVIHPNGFTEGQRLTRLLFQQCDRQSLRNDACASLSHLRWGARTPSELEAACRAWRRISRRLFGQDRPCLGRSPGLQG